MTCHGDVCNMTKEMEENKKQMVNHNNTKFTTATLNQEIFVIFFVADKDYDTLNR